MKLLIVDDEALQRQSIASIVSHSDLAFEKILLAPNAIAALEIMEAEQPEIVLSDISMPRISGLEFAREVRTRYPQTMILLITGYSKFEYAREGIDIQVFEYILKPIDREKILDSIGRAYQRYQEGQRRSEKLDLLERYFTAHYAHLQQQFLESLLFEQLPPVHTLQNQQQLFGLQFSHIHLAAFQILSAGASRPEENYYFMHLLHRCICEKFCMIAHFSGSVIYALIPSQSDAEGDIPEKVYQILAEAENITENPVHVGVSRSFSDLASIQQMRRQIELCMESLKESRQSEVLFCDDVGSFNSDIISISMLMDKLTDAVRVGNASSAQEYIDALSGLMHLMSNDQQLSSIQMIISTLLFNIPDIGDALGYLRAEAAGISACRTVQQGFDRIRAWVPEVCRAVQDWKIQQNNCLVDQLRHFIAEHFAEPIGLNEAARFVNRNSSYISRVFKQQTGKSFIQMLTETRIAEAKRLLEKSSLRVNEVAEAVGYPNPRHFYRVFYEHVGMTANNYRKITQAFADSDL